MGKKLAFLGLGAMGYPMAGHLQNKGHDVTVFNRSVEKSKAWVGEYGGQYAATPALAARGATMVLACVGNDDDVRQVTIGENGAFSAMSGGSIFVDHTTTSAILARELNEAGKGIGIATLEAPVSGGQAGAQKGVLTMMVGGDEAVFEEARPIFEAYAQLIRRIGPSGTGALAKMVNQICIVGLVQALSEGIAFALKAGLDVGALVEVMTKGAAQSWQMDNRSATMAQGKFDFGFAVDWMRKDMAICFDEATRNGAELPISKIVDGYFAELQKMGSGRLDTSSLITRLQKKI